MTAREIAPLLAVRTGVTAQATGSPTPEMSSRYSMHSVVSSSSLSILFSHPRL